MIKRILIAMVVLVGTMPQLGHAGIFDNWVSGLWRQRQQKPPTIPVLIVHDSPGMTIEVKGKYKLYDPHTQDFISTRFIGKRKFMSPMQDGLNWGEEFPGVFQLAIVPDNATITTIVDGIEYRGAIVIYDIGGTLSVVNYVEVEDYLNSILAKQYTQPLPEEELAAIAIAARTQAYYQAMNPSNTYWAVDGRKIGYEGYAVTHSPIGIDKAIDSTRYMALFEQNNPFPADWSKASIPLTEAENLAKKGDHAAQILMKAFPDASLKLGYIPAR